MSSTAGFKLHPKYWDKVAESEPGFQDYPSIHVVNPQDGNVHKSTIIILHGTSTNGPTFASELLHFPLPGDGTITYSDVDKKRLVRRFPNTRFVFPTGKKRPTTVFRGEESNAWFDIHDFTDRTIGEKESAVGIVESLNFLKVLIDRERDKLANPSWDHKLSRGEERKFGRIALGGFSQGAAMALISVLSLEVKVDACFCLSGWLPYRAQISLAMAPYELRGNTLLGYEKKVGEGVSNTIRARLGAPYGIKVLGSDFQAKYLEGHFFFGHGKADTKVKYEWGVQARDVVLALGANYVHREWRSDQPTPDPHTTVISAWTPLMDNVGKTDNLNITWVEVDNLEHELGQEEILALVRFLDDPEILSCELVPERYRGLGMDR